MLEFFPELRQAGRHLRHLGRRGRLRLAGHVDLLAAGRDRAVIFGTFPSWCVTVSVSPVAIFVTPEMA